MYVCQTLTVVTKKSNPITIIYWEGIVYAWNYGHIVTYKRIDKYNVTVIIHPGAVVVVSV